MAFAPSPSSSCSRCSGTGRWINPSNPDDRRECFACGGTGHSRAEAKPLRAPPRKLRTPWPGDDFFTNVKLGGEGEDDAFGGEGLNPIQSALSTVDLPRLKNELAGHLAPLVRQEIASAVTSAERDIKGWTRVELDVLAARIESNVFASLNKRLPQRIELQRGGVPLPEVEGHQHPAFGKLLRLATSRGVDGRVPNIWVTGPAGSGKTTGARNLAKALDVPFFYNGALETKFELLGYKDAGGAYHSTAFREAMERPSVYLFDDIDSCDSNAPLLALNGALANGLITFPDGQRERHPDSIVIATANTWGLGATADYVGRTRLDGAFLDRFGGKVHWGYDGEFERAISGNEEWTKRVQRARSAASAAGLKVLITPRASIAGAAYIAAGFTADEAAEMTYLAGLSADQRRIVS